MNSKKINQLATELTPNLSDLTIIGDPSTGISKKITLSQMASLFTGTVEEYASLSAFPLVGTADTIYIALDTNVIYRWNTGTSAYVELSPNIVTSLVFNDSNGFDGTISLVGSTATLTITTALTQGSVPFIGASGALTQDNANLFFDDTNNRLGINTNSPTTALDVFGSGIIGRINGTSTNNAFLGFASAGTNKWSIGNVQSDHRFRIYNEATTSELVSVLQTGEFGIGIANPTTKLHIDGGASALIANLDANVSVAKSISFRSDNSARINLEVSGTESGSNAGANLFIRTYTDAGSLSNANAFVLKRDTGYIGVGTDTPLAPIHINYALGTSNSALRLVNGSAANASNITKIALFTVNTFGGAEESAAIYAINPNAGTNNGGHLVFGTSAYSTGSTATEKMRLNHLGNLGIGTNSPSARLTVATSSGETIRMIGADTIGDNYMSFFNTSGTRLGYIGYGGSNTNTLEITQEANDPIVLYTNGTERARISAAGNFGIGTNNPTNKLDVRNSGDFDVKFRSEAAGGTVGILLETANTFSGTSQAFVKCIGSAGGGQSNLSFGTAGASGDSTGTERMRITSGGNLLLTGGLSTGVTDTRFLMIAQGTTSATYAMVIKQSNNSTNLFLVRDDGLIQTGTASGSPYNNTSGAAANVVVNSSGTLERSTSSLKYKTDVKDYDKGLSEVLKMRPVYYKSINEREKDLQFAGLIAEEIHDLGLTEFVQYAEDGTPDALAYQNMVALLTKAIQEQQAQIEELKALINK